MSKHLILASSSPRRQELLTQVNIPYTIRKADTDESQITTNDPVKKVTQLATLKGQETSILHVDDVILSADTVVSYQNDIFGKPKDKQDAIRMLSSLSGSTHTVYTGVMIRSMDQSVSFVEKANVKFWPLTNSEIDWYVSTEEPYDKAGAYGIQAIGAMFVKKITGDYFTIMGLPISRVCQELKQFSIYPAL